MDCLATHIQYRLYAMAEAVRSVGTQVEIGIGVMADIPIEIEVEKAGEAGDNFEVGLEDNLATEVGNDVANGVEAEHDLEVVVECDFEVDAANENEVEVVA